MAGINTRVVRRSNALQGWAYGRQFRYREVTSFGRPDRAGVLTPATAMGLALADRLRSAGHTLAAQRITQ